MCVKRVVKRNLSYVKTLVGQNRLTNLALAPSELFSFPNLVKSTPRDILSACLKPCALSPYAIVLAKAYGGTPSSAVTPRIDASLSVS